MAKSTFAIGGKIDIGHGKYIGEAEAGYQYKPPASRRTASTFLIACSGVRNSETTPGHEFFEAGKRLVSVP